MSRKIVLLSLLIMLAGSYLFAQKATITVFCHWFGEKGMEEITKAVWDPWQKQNPSVKIVLDTPPWNETRQQLLIKVSGGNAPDIVWSHPQRNSELLAMGALLELDKYYAGIPKLKDDIPKGGWDTLFRNGHQYGVYYLANPQFLFYNKMLMEKAGLSSTKPPTTLDEMLAMSSKIRKLGENIYGFGIDSTQSELAGLYMVPFFQSFGGDFADAAGKITVNSPENVQALTYLQKMGPNWPLGIEIKDLRQVAARDEMAFLFDGPWMRIVFEAMTGSKEKFQTFWSHMGWALFPAGPKAQVSQDWPMMYSICKQSKNPDIAWKVIMYLITDYQSEQWKKITGNTCGLNHAKNLPFLQDSYAQTILKETAIAKPLPVWPAPDKMSAAMTYLSMAMQKAVIENGDPEDSLKEAQKNIEVLYK